MSTNNETLAIRDDMIRLGQALKHPASSKMVSMPGKRSAGDIQVNGDRNSPRSAAAGDIITIPELDLDLALKPLELKRTRPI